MMSPSNRLYIRRRAALIEQLRSKGITHEAVLSAMGAVPRELFLDPALRNRAYADEALPIGLNQTISQPYTVAYQTMLVDPKPGEKVLEVGTGSGYQAAILCAMGVRVFSVERHHLLHRRAKTILHQLGFRALTRHGDGTGGWSTCAPFDAILVTAGARVIPESLKDQLRIPKDGQSGGRLVIPVGNRTGQVMSRIVRTAPEDFRQERFHEFRFVPLVSG